jgi:hypothetical protein
LKKGIAMTDSQESGRKFAFFVLGIAAPIVGWLIWAKTGGFSFKSDKTRTDQAHDVTVEDSFPASDPPSAW